MYHKITQAKNKQMKKIIIAFLIITSNFAIAQNDLKAKIEFEEAEKAFAENKFEDAYNRLSKTEKLLAKWVPNISYLKIKSLDQLCDYDKVNDIYTQALNKEVKVYMKFCSEHSEAVIMDKFKEVYAIEEKLNYASIKKIHENDPDYIAGQKAYKDKDYIAAMNLFKKDADKGNGSAMFSIGQLYRFGEGVSIDYKEAIKWYKKAVDKGNDEAMCYIGVMHDQGQGVPKDESEAMNWYKKAADKGNSHAMWIIGTAYDTGYNGVIQDYAEAIKWYKKAADKGNDLAMVNLANMYMNGKGVAVDLEIAKEWLDKKTAARKQK